MHIALARQVFAPKAKLILYTWQNVDRPKRWYVKAVLRTALRASDAVLCANREAVELARRSGYRKPVELLPAIGVDTRVFQPLPAAQRATPNSHSVMWGDWCRKRAWILSSKQSRASLRPCACLIVGDGPQRPHSRRKPGRWATACSFWERCLRRRQPGTSSNSTRWYCLPAPRRYGKSSLAAC